jgi:hypothetical protein
VFDVFFEDVESEEEREEIADLLLETLPHLGLNEGHLRQFLSSEHGDGRDALSEGLF